MRLVDIKLDVPVAVGVGASSQTRDLQEKAVQISGAFTGSLNIEVSLNGGSDYFAVNIGITAPGVYAVPWPSSHIRLVATALTGAAPAAVVAGFNENG